MNYLFIYLMGCLFGFGIAGSFIIAGYYKDKEMTNSKILFYGAFASWLTVLALFWGILKGIVKGVGEDED